MLLYYGLKYVVHHAIILQSKQLSFRRSIRKAQAVSIISILNATIETATQQRQHDQKKNLQLLSNPSGAQSTAIDRRPRARHVVDPRTVSPHSRRRPAILCAAKRDESTDCRAQNFTCKVVKPFMPTTGTGT